MQTRWYSGATRGQWLALAAALLGWAFDGFEQGAFPLVARPALIELEGLSEEARVLDATRPSESRRYALGGLAGGSGVAAVAERHAKAKKAVDEPVRKRN